MKSYLEIYVSWLLEFVSTSALFTTFVNLGFCRVRSLGKGWPDHDSVVFLNNVSLVDLT